jgi:hypothetical protein
VRFRLRRDVRQTESPLYLRSPALRVNSTQPVAKKRTVPLRRRGSGTQSREYQGNGSQAVAKIWASLHCERDDEDGERPISACVRSA